MHKKCRGNEKEIHKNFKKIMRNSATINKLLLIIMNAELQKAQVKHAQVNHAQIKRSQVNKAQVKIAQVKNA